MNPSFDRWANGPRGRARLGRDLRMPGTVVCQQHRVRVRGIAKIRGQHPPFFERFENNAGAPTVRLGAFGQATCSHAPDSWTVYSGNART